MEGAQMRGEQREGKDSERGDKLAGKGINKGRDSGKGVINEGGGSELGQGLERKARSSEGRRHGGFKVGERSPLMGVGGKISKFDF